VINEAMACGVPAVVSDAVGCGPDLVETAQTGAVFPVGDIAGLAKALVSVFAFEPSTTRQRLADRMRIYSPAGAANGIVEAANSL
jgi:glycosyltransferase involved in cell wall biosynthesis